MISKMLSNSIHSIPKKISLLFSMITILSFGHSAGEPAGEPDYIADVDLGAQINELRKSIAMEELLAFKTEAYVDEIEQNYPADQRDMNTIRFLSDLRFQLEVSYEKLETSWELYREATQDLEEMNQELLELDDGDDIVADPIIALEKQGPLSAKEKLFSSSSGLEGFMELKEFEDEKNLDFRNMVMAQNAPEAFAKKLEGISDATDQRVFSLYYTMEQRRNLLPLTRLPPPPKGYEAYKKGVRAKSIQNNPNVSIDAENAAGSESENNLEMAKELRELAAQETDPEKKRLYLEEAERLEKEI